MVPLVVPKSVFDGRIHFEFSASVEMYSRKRAYVGAGPGVAKRASVYKTAYVTAVPRAMPQTVVSYTRGVRPGYGRKFKPGYNRTSGFYGRYNQPGGGSEIKFLDTAMSQAGFASDTDLAIPGTGGQICLIPQGVTQSTRVGRCASVKSIQFRGVIALESTNGGSISLKTDDVFYMILVLDKQANGAAAAATDVFTTATAKQRMINLANSSRFQVLKTITKRLTAGNETDVGVTSQPADAQVPVEFYHRCNIPLEFSSTTGAITEIKSNNLFWFIAGATSGTWQQLLGTTRIRFSDD